MYELIQHSHSSPCRYPINIERRHFVDFRHFGEDDQGDSTTYTFCNTLRTLLLVLSRGGDPLLSNFSFFGRSGLVGCVAFRSSVSLGTGVFSLETYLRYHLFFSSPLLLYIRLVALMLTCCCVLGVLSLVSCISSSCPSPSYCIWFSAVASGAEFWGVTVFIVLLLSVFSYSDICHCS